MFFRFLVRKRKIIDSFYKNYTPVTRFFRKCRNSDSSCRIWSNLMYNIVLKLKIGRGAEGAARFPRKGVFGQIWVSIMLPFCDFEVSVMLPFSKILGHPLNQPFWRQIFLPNSICRVFGRRLRLYSYILVLLYTIS